MEHKREEFLLNDDTAKYQDSNLDNIFMAAISELCQTLQEAGYDPFDQLTGYVRTGNDQYITRRNNARKTVTDMDSALIKQYLRRYGYKYVVKK